MEYNTMLGILKDFLKTNKPNSQNQECFGFALLKSSETTVT